MSDLVSICIPTHNAEKFIQVTIDKIYKDTKYSNFEVIIIDDGSTDSTPQILKAIPHPIRFLSRENKGSNPTRNELLSMAKGTWVQFLDSDDELLPNKLESNLSLNNLKNIDAIYCPVVEERPDGTRHTTMYEGDIVEQWFRWQFSQTGGVLWRKSALEKIGGWNEDYPCCQDNELCLRAIQNELSIEFDTNPGALYRILEGTLSRSNPLLVLKHKIELQKKMLPWLHSKNNSDYDKVAGQALFENLRMVSLHDTVLAKELHQELKSILSIQGPAAPSSYKLFYRLFGFANSERLAKLLRRA